MCRKRYALINPSPAGHCPATPHIPVCVYKLFGICKNCKCTVLMRVSHSGTRQRSTFVLHGCCRRPMLERTIDYSLKKKCWACGAHLTVGWLLGWGDENMSMGCEVCKNPFDGSEVDLWWDNSKGVEVDIDEVEKRFRWENKEKMELMVECDWCCKMNKRGGGLRLHQRSCKAKRGRRKVIKT